MENDACNDVPFSSLVESIIRVGTVGSSWALFYGPYEATQLGLRGIGSASFVARLFVKYGIQCGVVGGVFSITRYGVQKYTGQDDQVNHWIAGAAVGAAAAAWTRSQRPRNRRPAIWMIGLITCLCSPADGSSSN